MESAWKILGIDPTDDLRAIKRAYAKKVRENNPEEDPDSFQSIRNAYEYVRNLAKPGTSPGWVNVEALSRQQPAIDPLPSSREKVADDTAARFSNTHVESQTADEKPVCNDVNHELVKKYIDEIVEAIERWSSEDAQNSFEAALNALAFESIDTALYFESELVFSLTRCPKIPYLFIKHLVDHYSWKINYVDFSADQDLQVFINKLVERYYNTKNEIEDAVSYTPVETNEEIHGTPWQTWVGVIMLLFLLLMPFIDNDTDIYKPKKDPQTAMQEYVADGPQRAMEFRQREDEKVYNTADPNCTRYWLSEDGMTYSLIGCEEWKKRRQAEREAQNGFTDSSLENPENRIGAIRVRKGNEIE